MAKGYYNNLESRRNRANTIGQVRIRAWKFIRQGDSKTVAFKKSWHIQKNRR